MSNPYASTDSEQSGQPSAKRTEMLRRAQIVSAALMIGAGSFMGVALLLKSDEITDQPDIVALVGVVFSAGMFLMHFVVPNIVSAGLLKQINTAEFRRAEEEYRFELLFPAFMTRQIIACAMLEGAAFLNLACFIVSGFAGNLIAAVVLIGLIAMRFPTASRLEFWVQDRTREIEMRTDFA